jgi:hypothetical protein
VSYPSGPRRGAPPFDFTLLGLANWPMLRHLADLRFACRWIGAPGTYPWAAQLLRLVASKPGPRRHDGRIGAGRAVRGDYARESRP